MLFFTLHTLTTLTFLRSNQNNDILFPIISQFSGPKPNTCKCEVSEMGNLKGVKVTAQKIKFSIKDFFSKCDQIRRKLQSVV